ncbi:hypothetical protein MHBO_004483, partial [Bonamia ostreae]
LNKVQNQELDKHESGRNEDIDYNVFLGYIINISLSIAAVHRQTGFSVYVFNDTSYTPPSTDGLVFAHNPATCPNQMMNVTVNRVAKGIALYNSKTFPLQTRCAGYSRQHAVIEICEVRVMGKVDFITICIVEYVR